LTDTIFSLSSAVGRAGLAVIRLSGPSAGATLERLSGGPLPRPRHATRAILRDPFDADILDDGLVLWFPAPHSYTGEEVVELHLHGGVAVVSAVLDVLAVQPDLRLAEPGEFTRRAFLSGKIDLTAAEGLIDLIDAETNAQRRQALRQADGDLGRLYEGWRSRLVTLLAYFEASIDFADEPIPDSLELDLRKKILVVSGELTQHLFDKRRGERLREGVHITILGAPNAGKSSLLNLLARRDAAIVSSHAGTTRDVVEVRLDLADCPVTVADTAGLRDSASDVEVEGVRRALARAEQADLKLVVFDGAVTPDAPSRDLVDADTIVLFNKSDLCDSVFLKGSGALGQYAVSVKYGSGIEEFLRGLTAAVRDRVGAGDSPMITRSRHREALTNCRDALDRAAAASASEFAAEDLRQAVRSLGRITGAVDVEDLLDVIFRDFCIGK